MTPLAMEMLMWLYTHEGSPVRLPEMHREAHREILKWFADAGVISVDARNADFPSITDLGKAWVFAALATPIPTNPQDSEMTELAAVDQACLILGTDRVQTYLLAGVTMEVIAAHADELARARSADEAIKGLIDSQTRADIMSGRLKIKGRPPELRDVRP